MIVLASDYDGTLKIKGQIAESDLEAIRSFQAAGNKFGISTGRTIGMIKYELIKYNVPFDFMICGNGGILVDNEYNVIERFDIDFNDALEMIEEAAKDPEISLSISDGDCYGKLQESATKVVRKSHQAPEPSPAEVDGKVIVDKGVVGTFVLSHSDITKAKEVYDHFSERFKGKMSFHYNNAVIDVGPAGIDKKTGIDVLAKWLNNPVHVIGDSHNDLPMIEAFRGYAVSHGHEDVKKKASLIFDSVKDCIDYLMKNEK